MEYKIETTIPVAQYGNMRQTLTPSKGQGIEDFQSEALKVVHDLWDKYGEKPLTQKVVTASDPGIKVLSFTGEELMYNDDTHVYTNMEGDVLQSGSYYSKDVMPKFDIDAIVPRTSKAWEVDPSDLKDVWKFAGDVATNYGSSIHAALEAYHLYKELGQSVMDKKELEFNYVLPKNKYLRDIVLDFEEKFGLTAEVEVLVSDIKNLRAGQIDRLEIIDAEKKICRIGDYKTNFELDKKKILGYQHQLSFYAHILMEHGWTVQGLDIFHLKDVWEKIELEVLDLVV